LRIPRGSELENGKLKVQRKLTQIPEVLLFGPKEIVDGSSFSRQKNQMAGPELTVDQTSLETETKRFETKDLQDLVERRDPTLGSA